MLKSEQYVLWGITCRNIGRNRAHIHMKFTASLLLCLITIISAICNPFMDHSYVLWSMVPLEEHASVSECRSATCLSLHSATWAGDCKVHGLDYHGALSGAKNWNCRFLSQLGVIGWEVVSNCCRFRHGVIILFLYEKILCLFCKPTLLHRLNFIYKWNKWSSYTISCVNRY